MIRNCFPNDILPSPLWGEGSGVRGAAHASAAWIAICVGALCVVIAWPSRAHAEPRFERLGVESCQGCHQAPSELYVKKQVTNFVWLTEFAIWSKDDKHSQAYELLESDLGQRICKALQIDLQDGTSSQQCLSCHADWQKGAPRPKPFDLKQGVTCEACHGAASSWASPTLHQQEEWRRVKPEDKFEKHGMIDIRDPITRARVCNSCHIGDREQGKFISHEMFVAGHPPLPPIEPETFADQMPRHWRSLIEKPHFEHRDMYEELHRFRPNEHSRSRGVVLEGIESLRASIKLFAGEVSATKGPWPDFAVFDCSACHHELTSKSWRLERGYGGQPPGRPPMPAWPAVLVPLAIRHAAGDDAEFKKSHAEFRAKLKALQSAIASSPFGDKLLVPDAANELLTGLDIVAQATLAKPFDTEAARQSLAMLSNLATADLPDFDSARQLAWTARILATEAGLVVPGKLPLTEAAIEQRRTAASDRRRFVDDVLAALKINEALRLKLPAGRRDSIPVALPALLRAQSEFDPKWFRLTLRDAVTKVSVK